MMANPLTDGNSPQRRVSGYPDVRETTGKADAITLPAADAPYENPRFRHDISKQEDAVPGTEMPGRALFPLFIDMTGKRALIVGAGKVAQRRISVLKQFGCILTVAAPEAGTVYAGDDTMEIFPRKYQAGDCGGFDIVLACTDDVSVNQMVMEEARERGILFNRADRCSGCDFQFPAIVRKGVLTIGLNAGGNGHKKVREAAEKLRDSDLI